TSTSSSSSSSPPNLVRHLQAAFKRHRPVGMIQPNGIQPRRFLAAQRETSKQASSKPRPIFSKTRNDVPQVQNLTESKPTFSVSSDKQDQMCITPAADNVPSTCQEDQPGFGLMYKNNDAPLSFRAGATDQMAAWTDDLSSHIDSLALTEKDWVVNNEVDVGNPDEGGNLPVEVDSSIISEGGKLSLLPRKTSSVQDQVVQHVGNFMWNNLGNAVAQSTVAGSSCATSTLVNSSTFAPGATYSSQHHIPGQLSSKEPVEGKLELVQPSYPLSKYDDRVSTMKSTVTSQSISSSLADALPLENIMSSKVPQTNRQQEESRHVAEEGNAADSKPKEAKVEGDAAGKARSGSRKRGYDPELFFKVNGKLYQRLGKIGSGGSSEVHKVISSDCTIYALKKIRLKGRDYATAYGFCQEIEYLNRLRGKNNIIRLIDYEVTDKSLLEEVTNGSMSNKDGRVKDDEYIYVVLEYGEIDLASMLSQKWKELDGSSRATMDENWLRFYWQQILLAVNTIHEERIVHSDLKPANFLLVRGSLKLIDFGIAKAISSDTTNIQRDSQVGTLSYMSPEAFMCNETDANGNTIKCGRPSDIWSLGCILYQMVYGRTPFSEYKTFWAKFKVITDPTHEISYEPVSNPWLLDLMRKCLSWDRNERWRIPQLLQHPFLVPPVAPQLPQGSNKLVQMIAEAAAAAEAHKTSALCSRLQTLLADPRQSLSRDQLQKLLSEISTTCCQLQKQL
ncbi:hypothetical protein M569_01617, partial [Genlisea aurea]